MVIIPKPNKSTYDLPKSFRSIVLLNTTAKLIEKMTSISNNFIHPCQLGGLKHSSTVDADVVLSHFVHSEWIKNLTTSTLVFNIM